MPDYASATSPTDSPDSPDSSDSPDSPKKGAKAIYPTPASIKRVVFSTDELETGLVLVGAAVKVCESNQIPVAYNFDAETEFPDGYSAALIPLTETDSKGNRVMAGLIVGAIPSAEQILGAPAGAAWAVKTMTDKLIAQLKTAVMKTLPGERLPLSVAEFVSTGKLSLFAGFSKVAPEYVKALKQKSPQLSFLSVVLLRQILASAQFAEQQFPRIKQENWAHIINAMMSTCELAGVDEGILPKWLETRGAVEVEHTEVDLHDIGELINADHAASAGS